MKILYIQHVGLLGGSSRSLYELLRSFPVESVKPHLICPRGQLAQMLAREGIPVKTCAGLTKFDNCAYSFYRSWRWLILLREFFLLFPTISVLIRARWSWGRFDLVHVNEITMPLVVILAKLIFGPVPVVMHARAVQRKVDNRRSRVMARILTKWVSKVVAIDQTVAESLPGTINPSVIHNGLKMSALSARFEKESTKPFTVAMIGVLNRSKGCRELVLAAAICRDYGYTIRFHFVGGASRTDRGFLVRLLRIFGLKEDISQELNEIIEAHGLRDHVSFLPFTSDLESVYRNVDVICFPSYLDAPGRPIFEAGFFAVPSIACISSPKADTFVPEVTGILIPPRDAEALARAIMRLCDTPEERARMGKAAQVLANSLFHAERNARKMLDLYVEVVSATK